MPHTRPRYAALSTVILETARGQLSFKQKVCCQVVCKEWRDLLRSPHKASGAVVSGSEELVQAEEL